MSASTPGRLRSDDAQRLVAKRLAVVGRGEVGAEIEQIVLHAGEYRVECGMRRCGVQPRQADAGVGLVDRAVGLHPQIRLQPALSVAQSGRAVVAGARVDLVEPDQTLPTCCVSRRDG